MEQLRFLSEEQVFGLKEKYGTPVFVYSQERIKKQVNEIMNSFVSPYGHSIRYSLKGNNSLSIIVLLYQLGVSFDAASEWEAMRALKAGVPGKKILITSQEYPKNIDFLMSEGVRLNLSSLKHIEEYGKKFPNTKVTLRINPGRGTGGGNRLTTGGINSSFGIWYEDIPLAIELLSKYNLEVELIHQHIGSGHNPEEWIEISVDDFLPILLKFPNVKTINLGGGYRVKSFENDFYFDYNEITTRLSEKIENFCINNNRKLYVEFEPSTYIMANSGSLITTIIDVQKNGEHGKSMLKIDSGLTEIMRPGFYGALHPLVVVPNNRNETEENEYLVYGHCCILGDCLTVEPGNPDQTKPMMLTKALPDDLLVVERAGGYSASMNMKNFNSFPEAPEVLIDNLGYDYLIKKRQTIDQIIQNEMLVEAVLPIKYV